MIQAMLLAAALTVAPDLDQRLARFKPVEMPFTFEPFNAREQRVIKAVSYTHLTLPTIYSV